MIQDKKTIDDFFRQGHFEVQTPDGNTKDYDLAIPDFYAKSKGLGECLDSNGSEAVVHQITGSDVSVDFIIYGRQYGRGSWELKNLRAFGSLIKRGEEGLVYKVERIEELPDDYDPFIKQRD